MARLSYVEMEQASPEVREVYEKAVKGKPGQFSEAGGSPAGCAEDHSAFLRQRRARARPASVRDGVHPRLDDQRLLLLHATSSGGLGTRRADATGLASVEQGRLQQLYPKEQAALKFAERLTRDPHAIGDADIANLKPHFL